MISNFDTEARTNLILPLSRHNLSISSSNFQASIKTSIVMSIHDWSSKAGGGASGTVVRSLRSWVSTLRPPKWPFEEGLSNLKESVFLLNSKPRFEIFCFFHDLIRKVSEVSICRRDSIFESVDSEGFSEDEDVVSLSERIGIESDCLQNNLGVPSDCLPSGRTVVVPFGKISERFYFSWESSLLGSHSVVGSVDPNVLGYDFSSLIEVVKIIPSPKGLSMTHFYINIMIWIFRRFIL